MGKTEISDAMWFFENILFTFGRLGVPLFLMLTGTLMLHKEYTISHFYKTSLFPLLFTTELWIVLNYIYYCVHSSTAFGWKNLLYTMAFLKHSPTNHMWYMPMILGMYLVIPFLAKMLKNVSFAEISWPFLVSFCAFSLVPFFNAFAGEVVPFFFDANLVLGTYFLGGVYGMLMVFGHYVGQQNILRRLPLWVLVTVFVVSFGLNTAFARYFYLHKLFHTDIFGWYTSPFIIMAAISIFEIIKRLPVTRCPAVVSLISKGGFAIYLMHNLVLMSFNKAMGNCLWFSECHLVVQTVIRLVVAFGIPLFIVFLADRLPFTKAKKLLFFMK